ncbi:MAG: PH domain-containing protein [Ancrocorticia sp.]
MSSVSEFSSRNDSLSDGDVAGGDVAAPEGAGLEGAGLEGAGLEGAGLEGAGLEGAGLEGAGLEGAGLDVVAAPAAVVDASERCAVPDKELHWHRFNKATMLGTALRLWALALVIAFAFAQQAVEDGGWRTLWTLLTGLPMAWVWRGVGILAAVAALTVLGAAVRWRFMRFALASDGIHFRSGVLIKKHVQMRWDRVQSVEVEQKLFARLLKMGSVSIDSAGGKSEKLALGLLTLGQCHALRQTILQAQADARSGHVVVVRDWLGGGTEAVDSAGAGPGEAPIYRLETKRLLAIMVLSPAALTGLLSLAASIWFTYWLSGVAAIPLFFVAAGAVVNGFKAMTKRWGTEVFLAANGVRSRSGLFSTFAETLPPGRVHAIEIYQPGIWRHFDWWVLRVTAAGKNAKDSDGKVVDSIIIPAGTREEVLRMLWVLVPNLGVEDELGFLGEVLDGSGGSVRFTPAPASSRWLDPFGWKRNAISLTNTAVVMRWGGFWRRSMRVVLHDHYQSLAVTQGPWERRLGLASLHLRTVAGTVNTTQTHVGVADAERLLWTESAMGKERRALAERESLESWRARVGVG